MSDPGARPPPPLRSLSARLLVMTIVFVMIAEVLIFVPSVARFRLMFLEQRVLMAHLASLALLSEAVREIDDDLERELLRQSGARAIVLKRPESRTLILMEDMPPEVDMTYDLRETDPFTSIMEAFRTLVLFDHRVLRVVAANPDGAPGSIEILLDEGPLYRQMTAYSTNILQLSIVISLITGSLVFLALHFGIGRPMRRLSASIQSFRLSPEDYRAPPPSRRIDEVGIAERELYRMQDEVRQALNQKNRLAALGVAVSKINHDLRNILATAQLVSDRLGDSDDPTVRRIAPRLIRSIDRAIEICKHTLAFGRAEEQPPRRATFALAELVEEVAMTAGIGADDGVTLDNRVPRGFPLHADRDQMFRILLNLVRNAAEAMDGRGTLTVRCDHVDGVDRIDVIDTGPGLPDSARERLFEPFAASAKSGSTGLGLAIARDLARGHDGDLGVLHSGPDGTVFRIALPAAAARQDLGRASAD
jgi:signal transduction histidine kinase